MKAHKLLSLFSLAGILLCLGCGGEEENCLVMTPPLPAAWEELMGECRWKIRWIDGQGRLRTTETGGRLEADFPETAAAAVVAWPFWPGRTEAGDFRPAGAIFPFDAGEGGSLTLSWKGGVDALFYFALAAHADPEAEESSLSKRTPWYFDWPRFRTLMEGEDVPADIREDPWLADWDDIALRTIQSGFDRRRIKARETGERSLTIPVSGRFIASSPFALPLDLEQDSPLIVQTTPEPRILLSAQGLLRYTLQAVIWEVFE
jgi:hypothetical protein